MARLDCSELSLKVSDWAMSIAAETGAKDIDSVVKEMKKTVPAMNRQMVVDSIVEATQGRAKQTDELAEDLNAIKREARIDKNTRKRITELEKYLDEGIAPPKSKRRVKTASDALQELRGVRDDLRKQVARSEPVQQARLLEQIRKLEDKIERGDIQPKQKKVETPKSKVIERLEFEKSKLQGDVRRRLSELKPKGVLESLINKSNVFKATRASIDVSAVKRQGGFFFLSRPWEQKSTLRSMFKAMGSEQGMFKVNQDIENNPWRAFAAKAKLFIAPTDGSHSLSQMEDAYQSTIAERIPGVRMSERAYVTFLNQQRMDMFSIYMETLSKDANPTLQEAQVAANMINVATGRGNLGRFEALAVPFNALFFSLRNAVSRFQIATFQPLIAARNVPRMRKLIAKEYARYLIGLMVQYGMYLIAFDMFKSALGKEAEKMTIEGDPRSSDFGKIRIGETRIDPLSGISQNVVLLSRLLSRSTKSTTTGEIVKMTGKDKKFFAAKPTELIGRFIKQKFAPLPATIINLWEEEDAIGNPFGLKDVVPNLMFPLAIEEVHESIQAQGVPLGTSLGMLALWGEGIQNYGSGIRKMDDETLKNNIIKNTYKRDTTVVRGAKIISGKRVGGRKINVRAGQAHIGKEERVKAYRRELLRRQEKKKKKREPTSRRKIKNALDSQGLNVLSKALKE
jgi:hypothetical protein